VEGKVRVTGADLVLEALEEEGVDLIFGYPGEGEAERRANFI